MPILLRNFNSTILDLMLWSCAGWVRARLSWMLLGLVAFSLVSMPITQHLWTWDAFLHGGQDFETGAFLILITLCLVVVLARSCKSVFERTLAESRALAHLNVQSALSANRSQPRWAIPNNRLAFYNPPLQI